MGDHATTFHRGLLVQPDCAGCPLEGEIKVPPEGNPNAKLAIVGESPGSTEEELGRPFVGASGQFLDHLLKQAEIERHELWVSNTTLCRTRTKTVDGVVLNPDQVLRRAAVHCRPRLMAELAIVNPRVIVGLGTQSVRSIYNSKASMKGRRGAVHEIDLVADSTEPE